MTSKENIVFGNLRLYYVNMWETSPGSANWTGFGLEFQCNRRSTQQTTGKHDNETGVLKKTAKDNGKLKRSVVKLAPLFKESGFL